MKACEAAVVCLYLTLLVVPSLFCNESVRSQTSDGENTIPDSIIQGGGYVLFVGDSSKTHQCLCESGKPSEYEFTCTISNRSTAMDMETDSLPPDTIPCSEVPHRVAAHIKIDCSGCRECVRVDLRELTQKHYRSLNGVVVYPPPELTIFNCQVTSMNINTEQLILEGVNLSYSMEVAQFGIPENPGVGGYYTVDVSYPIDYNASDCWLTYLHLDTVDLWYLPVYMMHRCNKMCSIKITNSPITWVSVEGIMALRSVDSLTLTNCHVATFGSDALQIALEALDEFITEQLMGNHTITGNNRTLMAVDKLKQMYNDSGRLNRVIYLYDIMDASDIEFSLVFGYRAINNLGNQNNYYRHIPWGVGLSYLNLAYNNLTEIPYCLSLFGYLETVNLSNNRITSLYRNWICWPPPVSSSNGSNRHCYWFRGSAATLKVLDLSNNLIDQIGEIQPWYKIKLEQLYLRGNQIVTINEDAFGKSMLTESLLTLNLDGNQLTYFRLQSLKRVEHISIQGNKIKNVELESIPKSPELITIKLANNSIYAIAKDAFYGHDKLESVDLSGNELEHIFYDSMRMLPRQTLGSRVVLHAKNQTKNIICDCMSVYAKIAQEENTVWIDNMTYHYPRVPDSELDSRSYTFFDPNQGKATESLRGRQVRDFLCNFEGSFKQRLPDRFCKYDNDTAKAPSNCLVACMAGCSCYHDENWLFSNLRCRSQPLPWSQLYIDYPVRLLDMSNVSSNENLRHISTGTFKWNPTNVSSELYFLLLNNSNVLYIEDNAFHFQHQLTRIFLNDNQIKTLRKESICTFAESLQMLALDGNWINEFDWEILDKTCLPNLMDITLSRNPWACSCDHKWLQLHSALLRISTTTQIVSDFHNMTCEIDQKIVDACEKNRHLPQWQHPCQKVNEQNKKDYALCDAGNLIRVCEILDDTAAAERKVISLSVLAGVLGFMLLSLFSLAIRRRHRLFAIVRVLVLLKYQRDRRHKQQLSRDSLPYDAMLWAADRDQNCLVDVMNSIRKASGGDELDLCVPESFLYSDLCSSPLTYFDCPSEGAKFSSKVVVALSERFLDTQYLALLQVIRELDSLGRSPFRDIVFLRLSSHKVTLRRERHMGPEDVEAFKILQRILSGSDIVYESVDWEYRLIDRIRNKDSASALSLEAAQGVHFEHDSEGSLNQVDQAAELPDINDQQQPLILEIEPRPELLRSRLAVKSQDWPPFHSDKVPEVFVMSALGSSTGIISPTKIVIDKIVSHLTGIRLGTNDAAICANWPEYFELFAESDRIDSYLMKRTRQFVLLLSNSLLNWFKEESAIHVEFQAFLAANTFKRRMLVVLVEQVDIRTKVRYQALANQRLEPDSNCEATGLTDNWFDAVATEENTEALDRWLDAVLYRRTAAETITK